MKSADHPACRCGLTSAATTAVEVLTPAWPERWMIRLLAGYKRFVSPLLPSSCRFYPTCSEYALEAIEEHGLLRGAALAAWRLLRCQPFARAGLDPVPGRTERPTKLECGMQ